MSSPPPPRNSPSDRSGNSTDVVPVERTRGRRRWYRNWDTLTGPGGPGHMHGRYVQTPRCGR